MGWVIQCTENNVLRAMDALELSSGAGRRPLRSAPGSVCCVTRQARQADQKDVRNEAPQASEKVSAINRKESEAELRGASIDLRKRLEGHITGSQTFAFLHQFSPGLKRTICGSFANAI